MAYHILQSVKILFYVSVKKKDRTVNHVKNLEFYRIVFHPFKNKERSTQLVGLKYVHS